VSSFTVVLGFASLPVAERTMRQFAATRTSNSQLVIVDNHYPLEEARCRDFWVRQALELGGVYLDPGHNLGLHEGLNFALREVGATRDDVMLGMDPDTRPLTVGWDSALIEALSIRKVGWASLWNPHSEREMRERGHDEGEGNSLRYWSTHKSVINSICGFNLGWVLDCGGFQEPSAYYGGLEGMMFPKCHDAGLRWLFLRDFKEGTWDEDIVPVEYKRYKYEHAFLGYPNDFATWLKEKKL
jgi:hypothetical protein